MTDIRLGSQIAAGFPPDTVTHRTLDKLRRECGPVLLTALSDELTIEVMLNPDGTLWHERLGQKIECVGAMQPAAAEAVIRTVAAFLGTVVTPNSPILEGEWPLDGSRFAALLPPVVARPSFAIRKRASAIFSLDNYVAAGILSEEQKSLLHTAIADHRNILVVGGTGSGKTTLVNALIADMVRQCPNERLVIIEDTGEIQCTAKNAVLMHTSLEVNMTMLLRSTLRFRPDRILVGEVRGPEALDLLMAWNTGHEGGVATIHANDAPSGLSRLETLVSMHRDAPTAIAPLIAEAVHVVVHIAKENGTRIIKDIISVAGFRNGAYLLG